LLAAQDGHGFAIGKARHAMVDVRVLGTIIEMYASSFVIDDGSDQLTVHVPQAGPAAHSVSADLC